MWFIDLSKVNADVYVWFPLAFCHFLLFHLYNDVLLDIKDIAECLGVLKLYLYMATCIMTT
jgi:hypothetical protein